LLVHRVTDEAYEAYRKAQHPVPAVSPGKTTAPVLSKLLVQPGSANVSIIKSLYRILSQRQNRRKKAVYRSVFL